MPGIFQNAKTVYCAIWTFHFAGRFEQQRYLGQMAPALFAELIPLGHLPGALDIYLPGFALSMVIVTLFLFLGIWFFAGRRRLLRM
jgi:hypothetical protein